MKNIVTLIFIVISALTVTSCKQNQETNRVSKTAIKQEFALPDWAKNAVIYEVNVRQFTPEGTFNSFAGHLDRIADMGVDILWLMPIYPISMKKRKATNDLSIEDIPNTEDKSKYLGSPYAVADYKDVNPDMGTQADFRKLVDEIHNRGMKVILDYVPNHTGWDNPWITDHPEWYTQDSLGNIIDPIDPGTGKSWGWTDVADLNYDVQEMRDAQLDAFLFWITDMDVDGFRHDVAHNVPVDFWKEVAPKLMEAEPDVFLLAEAEVPALRNEDAFHADYGWGFHHLMNDIAKGNKNASDIDEWLITDAAKNEKGFHIHFTSNHDENTWSGTVFDRMGDAHKALAVLAATFDGMPLIYGGQEEPLKHRLAFFTKDDIGFKDYSYSSFYKSLFDLKDSNQAIWNGEYGGDLQKLGESTNIFAFTREKNGDKVTVAINLSNETSSITINRDNEAAIDIFTGDRIVFKSGDVLKLEPWQYIVGSLN